MQNLNWPKTTCAVGALLVLTALVTLAQTRPPVAPSSVQEINDAFVQKISKQIAGREQEPAERVFKKHPDHEDHSGCPVSGDHERRIQPCIGSHLHPLPCRTGFLQR